MSISEYFIPFTRIGISLKRSTRVLFHSHNLVINQCPTACEHLLDQVARQGLFTDGLFSQGEPELTGLQGHVFIWVLGTLQHVLLTEENGCKY